MLCGSKKTSSYGSEKELLNHMSKSHSDIEESERQNMASSSGVPQPQPVDICPICGDSHFPKGRPAEEDSTNSEDGRPPQQAVKKSGHRGKARVQFAIPTDHSEDAKADLDPGRIPSIQRSRETKNHNRIERSIGKHLQALAFYFSNRLVEDQEGEVNSFQGRSADASVTEFEALPTLEHDDAFPKFHHDEDPPKLPTYRREGLYDEDEVTVIAKSHSELVETWDWNDAGRVPEPGVLTSDELERFFPDIYRQDRGAIWSDMNPLQAIELAALVFLGMELCKTIISVMRRHDKDEPYSTPSELISVLWDFIDAIETLHSGAKSNSSDYVSVSKPPSFSVEVKSEACSRVYHLVMRNIDLDTQCICTTLIFFL
jgi:hypothetical protein